MKKLLALIFPLVSIPAIAGDLPIYIETINQSGEFIQAIARVDNTTSDRLSLVKYECAFFVGGKAIAVENGRVENLAAGDTAYSKMVFMGQVAPEKTRCRLVDTRK